MAQGELLLLLAIHLALTGLPGVAAALLAASWGERRVPVLLAIALVASGAAAMLAFWAYYGAPELGQTVSFFVIFAAAAVSAWCLYRGGIERRLLGRLATPLLLWGLGSAFLVYFGFLHGGTEAPLEMSATRFSHPLPADNYLPDYFADWYFDHGHERPPEYPAGWLSSDRPPLQVGYILMQRPFGWDDSGLHYQVMGVVLQQLWIVGVWALLLAGRAGRVTRGLTMLAVLASNVAVVNGFFIWPKLLPAALLLAAAALVLTPLWDEVRRSLWGAALFAALLGLAMLGHGASVFAVVPLLAIGALRGLPDLRWLGVAAAVGIVLMAPWSAYQKYGDPPGNRLVKWMAAGVVEVDERGTVETIVDSYGEAGLGGVIEAKADNFEAIAGGAPAVDSFDLAVTAAADGEGSVFLSSLRGTFFFNLLPSLGLLLVGLGAMAVGWTRRRREPVEWRLAVGCLSVFAIGTVAWALLMFGGADATALIHQGSLAIPILGTCAAAVGLRATFPRFAIWLLGANAALTLALYAPSLEPLEGTSYEPGSALFAALFLAGFGFVALRQPGAGTGRLS